MLRHGRSQVDSAQSPEQAWRLAGVYAKILRRTGLSQRYGVRPRPVPGHYGTWGIYIELHSSK